MRKLGSQSGSNNVMPSVFSELIKLAAGLSAGLLETKLVAG